MKKIKVIVIVILFVILAVWLKDSFSINIGPRDTGIPSNATGSTQNKNSGLEVKVNKEGPVIVAAEPLSLESPTWNFEIVLDTHSEELSFDLVVLSELVDDQGRLHKPISWEGDGPTGHHRKGVLKFNPISPKPKSLELKIKNVGGVAERSFKWAL